MSGRGMRDRFAGLIREAEARGHVCVLFTLTLPARFHPLRKGMANAAYAGATPRDGQAWLRKTWAMVRAKLARRGLRAYGLRMAEPHHDGTPHWHVLVCAQTDVDTYAIRSVIRHYWRSGDDGGGVDVVHMCRGTSLAYFIKYLDRKAGTEVWAATWGIQLCSAFGLNAMEEAPCA